MWKHLPPFGHRRSNSKRGKNRDRNPRARANTIAVDERSPSRQQPSPPISRSAAAHAPPGPSPLSDPSTQRLMTAATFDGPQAPQAPTRASLKTWWNHFTFAQKAKREAEEKKGECAALVGFRA